MINENVYGNRDNWIVPGSRTEQGATLTADVYYYDDVADNDNLKVKVANYNTLATPITRMRSQISGSSSATGNFVINNNWDVTTSDGIDKTICQFGIGSQSGLANQEYWYTYYNDTNVTTLLITDSKDIINVAFGLKNNYRPHVYTNRIYLSPLVPYDNGYAYEQGVIQQTWGSHGTFSVDTSSTYGYLPFSGYADAGLITQIPIKNLKISPVIIAYDNNFEPKTFESISAYLAERQTYNKLCCIKIKFRYAQSTINDFNGEILIAPFFVDDFIGLNGLWGGNNDPYEWSDSKMHWFYRNSDLDGFIVAGRPPYYHDNNYNRIPWYDIYYSTSWSHESAIGGIVYQTPDFQFTLDNNNCFTCDVSAMTDNDITKGIRKQLASFGLFFVDSITDINEPLDSDKTFLGILIDGVAYGDYTIGADNRNQLQWGWDTMEQNNYDPDNPPTPSPFIPDPNGYNDGMNLAQLDGFETATQRYNLYKAQAHQVFAALWSVWDPFDESDPDLNTAQIDLKTKKMFLTNNPLDCVIGLKYFPVPADMIGTGSDTPVKLGALTLHQAGSSSVEIQCKMAQNSYIHDCGSVYCAPQYQDYSGISDSWIDQYVGFELYLPFCGSVKLDTATYIGKWVNVQYHIDYITGACTAYIGIPSAVNRSVSEFMEIRSGNCAIDVPISGIQQATLEANMFNATQQLKGAALKGVSSVVGNLISTAGKAAAKDIGGAVSAGFSTVGSIAGSVNEIQSAKFELQHTQLPARMIGSASALSGAEGYLSPMLIVTEPRLIEVPDNYGHSVGFACMRYGKLKDISSGYTEINSVDLDGIACTAEEKSIIRSVLAGGIYL